MKDTKNTEETITKWQMLLSSALLSTIYQKNNKPPSMWRLVVLGIYETNLLYIYLEVRFGDKNGRTRCSRGIPWRRTGSDNLHVLIETIKLNDSLKLSEGEALFFFNLLEKLFLNWTIVNHNRDSFRLITVPIILRKSEKSSETAQNESCQIVQNQQTNYKCKCYCLIQKCLCWYGYFINFAQQGEGI